MDTKIESIRIEKLFGYLDHDITLNEAGTTFIHGPNGCGKTTVLRLVSSLFSSPWDTATLFDTNYHKIIIKNNKNEQLIITRTFSSQDESTEARTGSNILFELKTDKIQKFKLARDLSSSRHLSSVVEDFLPFLRRVSPRTWRDTVREEYLNFEEIISKYGDQLPHIVDKKIPDWLSTYISKINLVFIKTQRLLSLSKAQSNRNRESNDSRDVIELYSNEIRSLISNKLAEQASVSQMHDRSFPERLLSTNQSIIANEQKVREYYDETENKIQDLVNAGLIEKQNNIPLPSKSLDDTEVKVLYLYLQDVNKKLGVFDELQNKIQLFLDIISSKLKSKRFTVNRNDGFLIETHFNEKEILKPTQLSSGEQHQIVLFYELIFKSKSNSLFLIDEPEISLHVDWQRSFLDDLLKISKVVNSTFLIATHSPQIIGSHRSLAVALEDGILED